MLYAPVYFESNVYAQQGFSYRPSLAINLAIIASQLFLRPNYSHYYFGDYYGSNYSNAGYYPPFAFDARRRGYDPFYAYQRWQNRNNRDWDRSVQADYQYRVDHEEARPPRTLAAQQALNKTINATNPRDRMVAIPLEKLAEGKDNAWKFQPVTDEQQQKLAQTKAELNQFNQARQQIEVNASSAGVDPSTNPSGPTKIKRSKSPMIANPSEANLRNQQRLKSQSAPPLDPTIQPKPRQALNNNQTFDPQSTMRKALPKSESPASSPNNNNNNNPPKVEQKQVPNVEPNRLPRADTKRTPNIEMKPAPALNPGSAPNIETKPVPKAETKPAPRVEAKPAPRVEAKPAPKVEAKPAPRVEQSPGPKPERNGNAKPDKKPNPKPDK